MRTKAIMAANSYKKMYGDKETCSNISIMSLRIFGARLETCSVLCNLRIWVKNGSLEVGLLTSRSGHFHLSLYAPFLHTLS